MARIAVLSDFHRAFGPDARGEKAELFRLSHRWWQQLFADAGLPANLVADLVFVKGTAGRPVLSEFNPLYSSGYRVPLARAWVQANLGAWLAEKAGYPPVEPPVLYQMAMRLVGRDAGSGSIVWPENPGHGPA